jgi:hypothetical protein
VTAHLHSAARTLEQILREMHPDQDWIVSVKQCSCASCSEWALGLASDQPEAPPGQDEEPSD